MKITWFGHSCFMLEENGYSLLLDPFCPDMLPTLPPVHVTVDRVLCSHQHDDHNFTAAATLADHGAVPFTVTPLETWHDEEHGALRGGNTMHIIESGGLRAAHLGDLGCMPAEEQLAALSHLDVMMIPVGGYYTINGETAREIVLKTEPRVVIPMHYKGKGFGFPELGSVEYFTNRFCRSKVQWYSTNVLDVTGETPPQVAVLSCPLR